MKRAYSKAEKARLEKAAAKMAAVAALKSRPITRTESRGQKRKHLDERLRLLYQRAMLLEEELRHLDENRFYRTCIFGSTRISPNSPIYQDVFSLARYMAWESIDVLTGGGPGLMEAANKGAQLGRQEKQTKSYSYGISIELPFEPEPNMHLDVKRHHQKFSSRLDDFMRLSNAIVVTPGGIGTLLELFFSWQLVQVGHITRRPIVLMGAAFWKGLREWVRDFPVKQGLVTAPKDIDFVSIVDTPEEVMEIVSEHHKVFREAMLKQKSEATEVRK